MDKITQKRLETRAKIIKSMGHPTRLFLVEELAKRELCVCEMTEMVGADMSTVSKHLSLLREAGIVESRKDGNKIIYSLRCPCVTGFFECVEKVIQSNKSNEVMCCK